MPMTRLRRLLAQGVPLALALCVPVFAAEPVDVGGSVNGYVGSGGLKVITPSIHAGAELDPRTRFTVKSDLDAVSGASFNYAQSKTHKGIRMVGTCWTCHPATDALSGATRNYLEVRRGAELGVRRLQGPVDYSASYLANRENDYASDGANLGATYTSPDANHSVGLSVSALFDHIHPVINHSTDDLRTLGADLSLSQVLSPNTLGLLAYGYSDAEGYMGNPYAFVQIGPLDTSPTHTILPRSKQRHTARLSLKQGLWTDAALQVDGRYYTDNWDVQSYTGELSLAQQWGRFTWEPLVRWQAQPQGAFFYKDRYDTVETYMTRDLKLAPHQSLSLGLGIRGPIGPFSVETRYLRYQRQDNLDYSRQYADGPESADLYQIAVTLP
jgi:hypothetical protein